MLTRLTFVNSMNILFFVDKTLRLGSIYLTELV